MARSLRRPPVRGTQDPVTPKFVVVPVRKNAPGLPRANYSVPDTSYWRVDKRTNRAVACVTVTPDGIELGWDTCGSCSRSIQICTCSAGVSLPNAIGYIFVSRGGVRPVTPPPPAPLAVAFRAPAPKRQLVRAEVDPVKPKRKLRRRKQEELDSQEADALVRRSYRKLKRA